MTASLQDDSFDWWTLLSDPEFLKDPHPHLDRLREGGAIQHDPVSDVFFILGHRQFTKIFRSSKLGRDTRLWKDGWAVSPRKDEDPLAYKLHSEFQPQMLSSNPPDHRRMRDVYAKIFSKPEMAKLSSMFRQECQQLLDAMPHQGELDIIQAYFHPMPLRALRNLFELPASVDPMLDRWTKDISLIGSVMLSPEQRQRILDALIKFKDYLRGVLNQRRVDPGTGMIARALEAWDDGTLNEDETITNLLSLLIAGHETATTAMANGLLALLKNPDQLALLRRDRTLIDSAVEEFLRYGFGGHLLLRVAIEDVELDGTLIPAGSMCIGLVSAVNRDPTVFEAPHTFDITRESNPHVSFGGGIHLCIGRWMGLFQMRIAFECLLERYPHMELLDYAWRVDNANVHGLSKFRIRVSTGADKTSLAS